jgi:hypothetical protein
VLITKKPINKKGVMKKPIFMNFVAVWFLAIFITSISGISVFAADSPNAKLLSIADVAKVTGIQGLKTAPNDPSKQMIGAGWKKTLKCCI